MRNPIRARVAAALVLLVPIAARAAYTYPVRTSANHRYLEDQTGAPFPILGRASWYVVSLPVTSYQTYLADTLTKGFDAIELKVITHDPRANNPPHAGDGSIPFDKRLDGTAWSGTLVYGNAANEAPDFTTPNAAYWSFIDAFVNYCEANGILILMFPAYAGYTGGNQGWMVEMVANGQSRMNTYGNFIANRYKNNKNIVWMMGGDYNPTTTAEKAAETGLIAGLKSVAGQSVQFSAEWNGPSICISDGDYAINCTLNGAYSFSGDVNTWGLAAWADTATKPAFLLEEPYDQEGPDGNNVNPWATQPVRRFVWWGWLSTIGGYMAGNGFVWPFTSGWNLPSHLNSAGAQDLARLNAFIQSIEWWKLVPSGMSGVGTLITAGGGSGPADPAYVAASVDPLGSILVAYVPPAHTGSFTVNMSNLAQTSTARWFDPTNAAYATIGTFPNSGTQSFNTPGNNSAGSTDWVLMIEGGGGSGGSDGGADAGTDGGLDAGADGGLDAGTDAGSTADAGNDGGPDAGLQSDAGGTGSTQVSCGCSQQPLDASWLIVFLLALALRRRPALRPRR